MAPARPSREEALKNHAASGVPRPPQQDAIRGVLPRIEASCVNVELEEGVALGGRGRGGGPRRQHAGEGEREMLGGWVGALVGRPGHTREGERETWAHRCV